MASLPSGCRRATRNEARADAGVHVIGVLFAISASFWLLAHVTGPSVVVSVSIYCGGLLAMVFAAAAYNLCRHHRAKQVLRRLDHAAIFIMIAATYTPFAVNRLAYGTGAPLLTAVWLCAATGVIFKLVFGQRFARLSVVFYLAMGWMIIAVIKPLSAAVASSDLWLLLAGGVVYSVGVIFFLIERIPYHKAIWHGFVLAAVVLQFTAIAREFLM